MAEERGYQGYANYSTWNINLWINNEEGSYRYWTERAEELVEDEDGDKDKAKYALADEMESEFREGMPDVELMWADLLGHALDEVDWHEVAGAKIDEVEYESEDDED